MKRPTVSSWNSSLENLELLPNPESSAIVYGSSSTWVFHIIDTEAVGVFFQQYNSISIYGIP